MYDQGPSPLIETESLDNVDIMCAAEALMKERSSLDHLQIRSLKVNLRSGKLVSLALEDITSCGKRPSFFAYVGGEVCFVQQVSIQCTNQLVIEYNGGMKLQDCKK